MGIFSSCLPQREMNNKSKNKKKKNKKNQEALTETEHAKLQLKRQRDRLKKYRVKCEAVIAKEISAARDLMKKKKKKQAILLLKKKKLKEKMLGDIESKLLKVFQLLSQIDEAEITAETMLAIEHGTEALKALNEEMSLEDVERIMDETQEAIAYQREIDEALSGKLCSDDEEEVELEFAKMLEAEEALAEELVIKKRNLILPDVPDKIVKLAEEADDTVVEKRTVKLLLE